MKTIEEAAINYCLVTEEEENGYKFTLKSPFDSFKAGARFAQEWISVDVKPDTPKRDEEGIFYSEYLLLKVKGYEHPFVGYYVKANDYEFFDIYPEVSEIVNQENITHYRYIDLK